MRRDRVLKNKKKKNRNYISQRAMGIPNAKYYDYYSKTNKQTELSMV